ncbi:class I SAM-dependent methyltransferase [Lampropedia aestuarii]|uniref:class I SAM-dependent methyltransferase n=1 Tax=Lampropedia aestuarii TaxID=2562762 RepID=UPI00246835D3|nr:methyltransferase domain-containing protein [Lampropedia aestuarii]MDH5858315.1 methyltransferase domain-containing protein [Lampropedia aestuarii]
MRAIGKTEPMQAIKAAWHARSTIAHEYRNFYQAWRKNPKAVGALVPSGTALARAITQHIEPGAGPVLELGVGTGVFTRAMLARGLAQQDLILVERDLAMAEELRRQFPHARIVTEDACRLERLNEQQADAIPPLAAVVCGLPLLNMNSTQQLRIVRSVFAALRPGQSLYLFTYGLRCPVLAGVRLRMGLQAERTDTVLANVPPAHVWRLWQQP